MESRKNSLEDNEFFRMVVYKINLKNDIYTSTKIIKNLKNKTIYNSTKILNTLGIKLTKDVEDSNAET